MGRRIRPRCSLKDDFHRRQPWRNRTAELRIFRFWKCSKDLYSSTYRGPRVVHHQPEKNGVISQALDNTLQIRAKHSEKQTKKKRGLMLMLTRVESKKGACRLDPSDRLGSRCSAAHQNQTPQRLGEYHSMSGHVWPTMNVNERP